MTKQEAKDWLINKPEIYADYYVCHPTTGYAIHNDWAARDMVIEGRRQFQRPIADWLEFVFYGTPDKGWQFDAPDEDAVIEERAVCKL